MVFKTQWILLLSDDQGNVHTVQARYFPIPEITQEAFDAFFENVKKLLITKNGEVIEKIEKV